MKNIKIKFNYLTLYLLLMACLCGYIKYALSVFLIIILHELGHVFIITLLGYHIKIIEIFPFGGITKIDKHLNTPIIHDLLIALFGILFQLILAIIALLFHFDSSFIIINYTIMIFNLLPIIPLDGSKILLEIYCLFLSFKKSLQLYYLTSFFLIIIYLMYNYKYGLNNYLIGGVLIYKTFEIIKNRHLLYHKFLLERCIYDDLIFKKVKNKNEKIDCYQKEVKYYYHLNSKVLSDKEFLINYYFNC